MSPAATFCFSSETAKLAKCCFGFDADLSPCRIRSVATLSNGDGITAELALFEQSRLDGKVLRQPARALRTLAGYQRRFPQGSLRAEAMLAQIDWLLDSGDEAGARGAKRKWWWPPRPRACAMCVADPRTPR